MSSDLTSERNKCDKCGATLSSDDFLLNMLKSSLSFDSGKGYKIQSDQLCFSCTMKSSNIIPAKSTKSF